MEQQQAVFSGWAVVEIMGHQRHVGMVTTEAYGGAVLFRIDQPEVPESEETLESAEWIGDKYAQPGSVVTRGSIPASSVLVGSGSIYRIIPCDEATAMKAIRENQHRPLALVKFIGRTAQIPAPVDEEGEGPEF